MTTPSNIRARHWALCKEIARLAAIAKYRRARQNISRRLRRWIRNLQNVQP